MTGGFRRLGSRLALLAAFAGFAAIAPAAPAARTFYVVKNLTSDGTTTPHTDPNLVNGWGLVAGPSTPWWVADNGTDKSTLYRARGGNLPLVVSVPGGPTGIVYNGGPNFVVTSGRRTGPALFMFATEEGKIWAWKSGMDAVLAADRSLDGAIYKGLAIATAPGGDRLYAADFHNGQVDVFDGTFHVVVAAGGFTDPNLPSGFAPFGIQTINGHIFVSYAQQDADAKDEIHGAGLGYVDEYDPDGVLVGRVASAGDLNAPWGLALAPATGFGPLSGTLLVGNFGDGTVHAFDAAPPHAPRGPIMDKTGAPIVVDGLWGIQFGNGGMAGPPNVLYFAAGPMDEAHGLFGSIKFKSTLY